ncbi:4'-phosphopantetheinyl transferase family protein [Streptomyces tropicalis]|uniref:4'-phosphopantetheinyl transferase superfamily protein n=1 Tax=Streptomyces tropicalis TaxID=3034234 RepID=A0ABT6A332_9ACTN|nr:4'-phosphopantetheinyl transferase superfamily protein [Streptomyces tropicalis]MDF3299066.1 4'-phosphopantetheinyl transferase superfamily protein [Streptomyces tropicalis]
MPTRLPRTTGPSPAAPAGRPAPAHPDRRPDGPRPPTPAPSAGTPLALVRATTDVLPLLDAVRLAPHERDRAARLPAGERREDYLAAHVLVRLCAARLLGVDPAALMLGQLCGECGGRDHGRPFLRDRPGVGVSLSHARGAVAAAAAPGPVGVDVENAADAVFSPRLAARVLAPAELAAVRAGPDPARGLLRLWVRKEALVKVGAATLGGLHRTDLVASGSPAGWRFADWSSPDGRLIAAAVAHTVPAVDGGSDLGSSRSTPTGEQHA